MQQSPVRPLPGQGLVVDLKVYEEVRVIGGDKSLWNDEENRDNLLFGENSQLKPFLARFVKKDSGFAVFEMRRDGQDVASKSVPVDPARGIPPKLKEELRQAFAGFQQTAADTKTTEEAKQFIDSLRLANPSLSPEMYRLFREDGQERLLVLWGCAKRGTELLLPLDAIGRLPTERAARAWLKWLVWALLAIAALLIAAIVTYEILSKFTEVAQKIAEANQLKEEAQLDRSAAAKELYAAKQDRSAAAKELEAAKQNRSAAAQDRDAAKQARVDAEQTQQEQRALLTQTESREDANIRLTQELIAKKKDLDQRIRDAGTQYFDVQPRVASIGTLLRADAQAPGTITIVHASGHKSAPILIKSGEPFSKPATTPGLFTFQWAPDDRSLHGEYVDVAVYAAPLVQDKHVVVDIPPGVQFEKIDWGDKTLPTDLPPSARNASHDYHADENYLINLIPNDRGNEKPLEMPVTIGRAPNPGPELRPSNPIPTRDFDFVKSGGEVPEGTKVSFKLLAQDKADPTKKDFDVVDWYVDGAEQKIREKELTLKRDKSDHLMVGVQVEYKDNHGTLVRLPTIIHRIDVTPVRVDIRPAAGSN